MNLSHKFCFYFSNLKQKWIKSNYACSQAFLSKKRIKDNAENKSRERKDNHSHKNKINIGLVGKKIV